MEEKRNFFRITDNIYLSCKATDQQGVDEGVARLSAAGYETERFMDALGDIDKRIAALAGELEETLPEIAAAIKLLNRKAHLLGEALIKRGDNFNLAERIHPNCEVSLSASGISYKAASALQMGELLELDMVLFPQLYSISAYGKVVDCRSLSEGGDGYEIGVEFVFLREEDRDFVIKHALERQSKKLRESKIDN